MTLPTNAEKFMPGIALQRLSLYNGFAGVFPLITSFSFHLFISLNIPPKDGRDILFYFFKKWSITCFFGCFTM